MVADPTCREVQEAISAALDAEESDLAPAAVVEHVARCDACRDFEAGARALHAAVRVRPAPRVPDRSRAILAAARADERSALWLCARGALAVVALVEGVIFTPALLYGDDGGVPTHAARHLGAFGIAFAVALLVVAIRPRQARSLVPMTATLAAAMVIAAIVDTVNGKTSPFLEAHHLLEVLGTALGVATRRAELVAARQHGRGALPGLVALTAAARVVAALACRSGRRRPGRLSVPPRRKR